MQTLQRKRCQTRTRPRKNACTYGAGVSGKPVGQYGNGGTKSAGRMEYIWLPTDTGQATLIGLYRGGRFYAVHTDHLGTPRRITDDTNKVVWQWSYSAFGDNKPTGPLKVTANPKEAVTNSPALLKATAPSFEMNLRMAGQYSDSETGLFYNYFRSYRSAMGRYDQFDPIGLAGGLNGFGYVGGNPLSHTDRLGLATDEEIRKAVATLRCANPDAFRKLAKSITMVDLADKAPGVTDWRNNIQLNSRNYGDSNTSIYKFNEYAVDLFLQTIAHEMLHVNEATSNRLLSNSFRMGNLLGYFHRQLDEKAEAMITPALLKQFRDALANGDVGCSCSR